MPNGIPTTAALCRCGKRRIRFGDTVCCRCKRIGTIKTTHVGVQGRARLTADRIAELAALAERGLPLFPRRPPERFRRLNVDEYRYARGA